MSGSPTPKTTLRPSKFIEGPPLTSTTPNLAQTNEQLHSILLEMDSYESSRKSQRQTKSRSSSSSSSNSHSSHSSSCSTSSFPFFASCASKRMSHDYSASTSPPSTSTSTFISTAISTSAGCRKSGVRANLDTGNACTALSSLDSSPGRSRGSTIESMNAPGLVDEGSIRDVQILGLKIKGRLRAWSRGKDDMGRAYAGT
ncbi:hypothetical protein SBOR_5322 [Sclerotinia borealis F-4128]|uniref:Uncharacterized protein n=1 Tax=Sclerotinia borealis (strain F-4128) TaxID=1432307 RepID=W9CER5_SCLBF|nr:hypothetical protein SBOR_5322 [Sclerotinia borealis F-4128]